MPLPHPLRGHGREQAAHLEDVPERHGPVGDAMDEHGLQNPLDVVERVTHAGQAATAWTEHTAL